MNEYIFPNTPLQMMILQKDIYSLTYQISIRIYNKFRRRIKNLIKKMQNIDLLNCKIFLYYQKVYQISLFPLEILLKTLVSSFPLTSSFPIISSFSFTVFVPPDSLFTFDILQYFPSPQYSSFPFIHPLLLVSSSPLKGSSLKKNIAFHLKGLNILIFF